MGAFKDPESAGAYVGFIAGVIGANPERAEELIGKMFPLPEENHWVIVRAIAYSGIRTGGTCCACLPTACRRAR